MQGQNIYGIYMTFLGTLLERLHEYVIFVGAALVIDNVCGFTLIVTFGLSELKFYYEIFYPARDPSLKECAQRTKRVPENIHDLLTPRAVAYWFMDDGYCKPIKYKNRTYINYTFYNQSFPLEDQKILVQAL